MKKMIGIPKEKEIENYYLSEKNCIEYLFDNNILYKYERCPFCHVGDLKIYGSEFKLWRCNHYKCQKKISIFKDSFFAKSRLSCNDLLRISYKWISGQKYTDILAQTKHSTKAITATLTFLRELVSKDISFEENIIGGPGIIVEVDESKFGKVKYGHGHRVEGVWILGGVERTLERRIFLTAVPDRKRETLMAIISQYIAAGSIIHTDLWRGYLGMENYLDATHKTVNHSLNFKDPSTGVHTNTIEGSWFAVKYKIAPRNRTKELIDTHLGEFIWRRQKSERLWEAFIHCLQETNYISG